MHKAHCLLETTQTVVSTVSVSLCFKTCMLHGMLYAAVSNYRAATLMSQNHMTNYFRKAKELGVQCSLMISLSVVNREGLSGRRMCKEVILERLVQFS